MEIVKKYLFSLGISIGLILILAFFLNILNYFDILSINVYKMLLMLFSIFSITTGSYYLGNKSDNKGYLNGLIYGIIIVLLFLFLSIISSNSLNSSSFIYYLIIIISSLVAGTIGINKKITNNNN